VTPVHVSGVSGAVQVAQSGSRYAEQYDAYNDSYALTASGSVLYWGWGGGPNDTVWPQTANPETVAGLPTIIALAGGEFLDTLALSTNGTVWGWGFDDDGQLGNGSTSPTLADPALQATGLSTVTEIASGGFHSLALRSDGS